ncbi:leucyl/phenylalanyl-tRNA--protein transferase [Aquimarina sp. ERC-38]|uniref:leucyl/phenylalanyl-tRNA--protein transferase n=1 Tax=Aquimarina sp. ERC-38 TaxID=2949996 RepID=UPI002247E543|nr:leucyl/phenylalanyl-tRNA--protein transferase [Aquimarina sp. ERC-38]UZO81615.1 leucyl/phenylalanyl-tRNA--protein transferase [Aquimarina sp. ERC-38]
MFFLNNTDTLPDPSFANDDGLVAVGGTLTSQRLLEAYHKGIFPWYSEGQPVLWFSPDPRMVLLPEYLKISKSMRSLFKNNAFEVTYNTCFSEVIRACATVYRKDQVGTWITDDMIVAYEKLYNAGHVLSVEVWKDQELVGGLYGVYLKEKRVYCGESMFSYQSNASKYGFISLVRKLETENIKLIDCQMYTDHLASLGAFEIPRSEFLKFLE